MTTIRRIAIVYVVLIVLLWIVPLLFITTVRPDEIGVRQSNFSGVYEADLSPGWATRLPGAHKIIKLPRGYDFLDYTEDDSGEHDALQIRTKDNNTVFIDVSVPYRIKPGEGWKVVTTGNHQREANGRYRFQKLAKDTTVSVLRERLAELSSNEFYSTQRRLDVAATTLGVLNEKLAELHLEAESVLIRQVKFRTEYENQLQQIQLAEQRKLLDEATEKVAAKQQELDNYMQETNALAASLEQEWIERRTGIERAFEVGVIDVGDDMTSGTARRLLDEIPDEEMAALREKAAKALEIEDEAKIGQLGDSYLLGIRNIKAETLEYERRVRTEADGIQARLSAEGNALLAAVRGEFEGRLNSLLDTPAGRAYVAYQAAANVKFDDTLVFNSGEGIPSLLRLRDFTEAFMGD